MQPRQPREIHQFRRISGCGIVQDLSAYESQDGSVYVYTSSDASQPYGTQLVQQVPLFGVDGGSFYYDRSWRSWYAAWVWLVAAKVSRLLQALLKVTLSSLWCLNACGCGSYSALQNLLLLETSSGVCNSVVC